MLIDGNADLGIDVAVLTKAGFEIGNVRPHLDNTDGQGLVFSRDRPEFSVTTPSGETRGHNAPRRRKHWGGG
jgi:hypothetical protein